MSVQVLKSPQAAFLGIVMLHTQFPRPLGDIGNPDSYTIPVHKEMVRGVWPSVVVSTAASMRQARMVPAFQAIVRNLEHRGAKAITTSCGFLVLLQKPLQEVVRVPVVTSSLLQLAGLLKTQQRVGVLTISASALGKEHLRAAGVPRDRMVDVVVQGVDPNSEFATRILGNHPAMDLQQAQTDVVAAAMALQAKAPDITTVVLECTNMPPYLSGLQEATGLQFVSLMDDARLFKPFKAASSEAAT